MPGKIFTITPTGTLAPLVETPFASEDDFQRLIATHPDLLAGDQIDPSNPRRWLLVAREASIPDATATGRWSVDHLFLDQDGVPTLVEVKRSEDTRIRREVVGQLLEYASHAQSYWSVESVAAHLQQRCNETGADFDRLVEEFADEDSAAAYWNAVATNLDAGRLRLIFVAERIPAELRRIIEFLNDQMDPAEVLGVELPVFTGEGQTTIAPRVVGQTTRAQERKSSGRAKRRWDEPSFLDALEENCGTEARRAAHELLRWAEKRHSRIWWGSGATMGSFIPSLDTPEHSYFFFAAWTTGPVEMQFQHLRVRPPFDDESTRRELLERLNAIPGIDLPEDGVERRPSFPIGALVDPEARAAFEDVLEWALAKLR